MCTFKGNEFISRTQIDMIAISKNAFTKKISLNSLRNVIKVNDLFFTLSVGLSIFLINQCTKWCSIYVILSLQPQFLVT